MVEPNMLILPIGLIDCGLAFVFLQSTLISSAQQLMPMRRGTVMTVLSFNMLIGGAIGVQANREVLGSLGFEAIFMIAAGLILTVSILANTFLNGKE